MSEDNVYLIPYFNEGYISCLAPNAPEDGIFLVKEESYPTNLIYGRLDMNLELQLESTTIYDSSDLLKTLDWMGAAGYCVQQLWSFDREQDYNFPLEDLFCDCIDRREAEIVASYDEIDLVLDDLEREELDESELPF